MSISDVLHGKGHKVVMVRTTDTVQSAVRKLADERIGAVVVEDQWMRLVPSATPTPRSFHRGADF